MTAGTKEYTHLEMEAALCVWECINDWTLPDMRTKRADWIELREGVGSVEMRHQSIVLGKWCLQVYEICTKHDPDFFDGVAYDWEVIPMILDYARDPFGSPAIYAEHLPSPEQTALLVAYRHLYNEFVSDCTHESKRRWEYKELVTDDGGERMQQAFEIGEEPAEFVKWLGEKYDLIPADEWKRGF
jgi:hypothetical protein